MASPFTNPSDPRQRAVWVEIPDTSSATLKTPVPSPVNGLFLGFDVAPATTITDAGVAEARINGTLVGGCTTTIANGQTNAQVSQARWNGIGSSANVSQGQVVLIGMQSGTTTAASAGVMCYFLAAQ